RKLCQKKYNNPFIPNTKLASFYNIKPNTISDILKRKSEYLSISSSELERKQIRQPIYKEVNEALSIWMS
ncbi:20209_t:CDS:1, partial [Funneliformis geosporum]